jgi:hypothetical protein
VCREGHEEIDDRGLSQCGQCDIVPGTRAAVLLDVQDVLEVVLFVVRVKQQRQVAEPADAV